MLASVAIAKAHQEKLRLRLDLLKGGKRNDKDGILYLGDGSWGVKTRSIPKDWEKKRPYLAKALAVRHLIKVTMTEGQFVYEAMTAEGDILDEAERPVRRKTE